MIMNSFFFSFQHNSHQTWKQFKAIIFCTIYKLQKIICLFEFCLNTAIFQLYCAILFLGEGILSLSIKIGVSFPCQQWDWNMQSQFWQTIWSISKNYLNNWDNEASCKRQHHNSHFKSNGLCVHKLHVLIINVSTILFRKYSLLHLGRFITRNWNRQHFYNILNILKKF